MTNVPVRADPNTRYVSQTAGNDVGNTCANASIPCRTIQHAIDVVQPDDEIRVAGGTYSNTGSVAVITKPMSLVGGYDPNFTSSDPEQYPTTLDALGAGSVISIASVSDVPWLTEDLDGKPRPQGGKWDMGASRGHAGKCSCHSCCATIRKLAFSAKKASQF